MYFIDDEHEANFSSLLTFYEKKQTIRSIKQIYISLVFPIFIT